MRISPFSKCVYFGGKPYMAIKAMLNAHNHLMVQIETAHQIENKAHFYTIK